ncbi:MAG: dihydroneopterin aldolase [Bacteroidetes bacterium RIFCSPHIGHO2_02_FULL_44_7]|nr:MAG: dihydroneopterin aldolase [Bacteroidetes bacterium RIFCSPHIGHO2_02_FULL_44_7]
MKHVVELNGVKVYAYHGCLPEEALIGGHYRVDVSVTTDFSLATASDDLLHTVDYVQLNAIVKEEMAIRSRLIEHVGQRIVRRIRAEIAIVERLKVKIVKICPPINGDVDNVAIIIEE